ncbi:50S ribosomal protein L6 [Roseospirillum parvum]|uniref:Large ribosomal subunit protein uL6 n=1 Tax=Roseospirillum parvum TaxID=83401 RepID=A0A1G8BIG7_9PROT|nr:50S ribosomal protein L6 [Roseospirillum parvum]SDH32823.1 large subunit ribosomal protein L6 [Roseospirillum parvum]
MSRVGKYPVKVPDGVNVTLADGLISVKGKLGEMSFALSEDLVETKVEDGAISVAPRKDDKRCRVMWGTTRARIQNMVTGVSAGFTRTLEINGVGYRAQAQGKTLSLALGYSHDINYPIPEDLDIKTPQPNQIHISGRDKQRVGQVASEIRAMRPPEPYKGKGVKYAEETILRKEGKKK